MTKDSPTSLFVNPRFQQYCREFSKSSDFVWFLALNIGIGFTLIAAYLFPFSVSGNFWAYAGLMIRASLYLWSGEALKGRGGETLFGLFRLGIVAGLFELLVDWGLIHWISHGRLVYLTGNDVVLLGSPIWMPLAWACVIVELGYPALRLFSILKKHVTIRRACIIASCVVAAAAALTIGFYEYFAYKANWWRYEQANVMIGEFCAVYIPLGEFFMFLFILPIAARTLSRSERPLASSVEGGVIFALVIACGYTLAYLLLEAGKIP